MSEADEFGPGGAFAEGPQNEFRTAGVPVGDTTLLQRRELDELRAVASFGMREYHARAHSMDFPLERCDKPWCKRAAAALAPFVGEATQ